MDFFRVAAPRWGGMRVTDGPVAGSGFAGAAARSIVSTTRLSAASKIWIFPAEPSIGAAGKVIRRGVSGETLDAPLAGKNPLVGRSAADAGMHRQSRTRARSGREVMITG